MDGHWEQFDEAESNDVIHALHACIGELTPNARRLIDLRYRNGLSGVKLADTMGKQLNTVYVALTRIHRTLAECITRRVAQAQEGDCG